MTEKGIVYPAGVRELSDDLTTDELVRRLKDCAQAFQNMSQDDDNSAYIPLAEYLVSETFLEHPSRDVQLLVACCIADVFRVFAPDAPYKCPNQLKIIFEFFVDQLRGLEDPSKPSFKRHFYLLENLSCVKTFNICVELEDNQRILCRLFKLMFKIINENHSPRVKKFILDMLSPLISEADAVSQELLEVILSQIIEPAKSKNHNACSLAQDILKRNMTALEPYIQTFFNNALMLGKTMGSDLTCHLYELIYELNGICPSMLIVVLQQLEFKIKSTDDKERIDVTTVLGRMFSEKNSTMIEENKNLWNAFLSRFNDMRPQVRICCIQFCTSFLLNHPECKNEITDHLKSRLHDHDENVRYEVVTAIVNAAKEDFSCVSQELLSFVKERTLDKKFKIRKEALLGLADVYKKVRESNPSGSKLESISWIRNKVLHAYYQTTLEDKLLVERILHTRLVPYYLPTEERMKLLYQLFCKIDDNALKSFKEIIRCQSLLRSQMKSIIEVIQSEKNDTRQKTLLSKISVLSKSLPEPIKSKEVILKFCNDLESDLRLRHLMSVVFSGNISCSEAEKHIKEILKSVAQSKPNAYFMIIKQLLERIAPLMIDQEGIKCLVKFVKDSLHDDDALEAELGLQNSSRKGLELLWVVTFVNSAAFHDEQIYNDLLLFLKVEDEEIADMTLQIFTKVSNDMEMNYPEFCLKLLPNLENFVESGTPKQAKHAIYCIHHIVSDKETVFGNIIDNLKKHLTLQSEYFRTALVSIGHIAYLCHDMFATDLKNIVAQVVVRDLLMIDQDLPRGGDDTWGPLDSLPDETKVKIEGMKVMVRWLLGLKNMTQPAISTLRLLTTVILHDGDLMERQHTAPIENSWMRLSAANCMLKLCQESNYAEILLLDQFQVLASVMNDKCPEVRDQFLLKLNKGLFSLKLPLQFLAIFSLAALDERETFQKQVKTCLLNNINKRKEYIKSKMLTGEILRQFLPDYVLPYAVHLLAHSPILKSHNDVPSLKKIKECLWFLMEPLMLKNDNYSFSFFKRLLENIKQTKDQQDPENPETNMKLYAVSDLALSIVMTKTTTFVLKDFPVEPALPGKLYTEPDPGYSNLKTYLPPELIPDKTVQRDIGIEIFEGPKTPSSVSQSNASETAEINVDVSQSESIVSEGSLKEKEIAEETTSDARTIRSRSKTRKKVNKVINNSKTVSNNEKEDSRSLSKIISNSKTVSDNDDDDSRNLSKTVSNNDKDDSRNLSKTRKKIKKDLKKSEMSSNDEIILNESPNVHNVEIETSIDSIQEQSLDVNKNNTEVPDNKKSEVKSRPLRSSHIHSIRSTRHSKCNNSMPLEKQNGILVPEKDINSISIGDIKNSLKECNVSLRKDEVEKYIALNNSSNDLLDENCINHNDNDSHQMSLRHKNKSSVSNASAPPKKRKRDDDSPSNMPLKSKSSLRIAEKISNSSSQSSHSAVVLEISPSSHKSSNNLKRRKRDDDSPIKIPVKYKSSLRIAEKNSSSSQSSSSTAVLKTSSSINKNNNSLEKGNKLPVVNGSRVNKDLQKTSASQKSQKSGTLSPIKRSQRNQGKLNLRKR